MTSPKGDLLRAVVDFVKKLIEMLKDIFAKLGVELPTLKK